MKVVRASVGNPSLGVAYVDDGHFLKCLFCKIGGLVATASLWSSFSDHFSYSLANNATKSRLVISFEFSAAVFILFYKITHNIFEFARVRRLKNFRI